MSSALVRSVRPIPKNIGDRTFGISNVEGVKTIRIGVPSDDVKEVVCQDGVILQIFDFAKTPIYKIIPSILELSDASVSFVIDGIFSKMYTSDAKNPSEAKLYGVLSGLLRSFKFEMQLPDKFSDFFIRYLMVNENRQAIKGDLKTQVRDIPDVLHSMQISEEDNVMELCKVDDLTFSDLVGVLSEFVKSSKAILSNDTLVYLAGFLNVRKGYTGDTRETPIPHASKGESGGMDLQYCYVTRTYRAPANIIDLLGLALFRHIGLHASRYKVLLLFTELLHSKIPLNTGVKEVLEELLSRDFVASELALIYKEPESMSQWRTSKFVANIADEDREYGEVTSFLFLFQEWYGTSRLRAAVKFENVAKFFGFNLDFLHKKTLAVLNDSFKSARADSKPGFPFMKWRDIVRSLGRKKINDEIVRSPFEEYPRIFGGLYSAFEVKEEKYTKLFNNFMGFMKLEGIEFKECFCCNNLYMAKFVQLWKTMPCTSCSTPPVLCAPCHIRICPIEREIGRVLSISTISCICCRTIFGDISQEFPEGTLKEDIIDHSNEFYSCCLRGCRNFVRVQQEGVGCADRPDTVVDTFCTMHSYMNDLVHALDMYKECPGCGVMVTKSDGCNHMTCSCHSEFCMREGCPYVKPEGVVYTHPFYCRYGISDSQTRHVLDSIVNDLRLGSVRILGVIPQELMMRIFTRMHQIVYQGIETPLRTALWELSDYMNSGRPDAGFLTRIMYDLEPRLNVDFPI